MEYTTLGRTGLKVSVAGLGCGGFSRLGLGTGKSEADAVDLVHEAFSLGVNLFDTAAVYGTEAVLGKALKSLPRDQVVITTKAWTPRGAGRSAADRVVASLDHSLKELGTDYIDVFQLHGVAPAAYGHAREVIAPVLLDQQTKGKIRFLGVTETGSGDAEHEMVQRAVDDGVWDVVMIAFHMMHQNARQLGVSAHGSQWRRDTDHVRGAQHLFKAAAAEGRTAPACVGGQGRALARPRAKPARFSDPCGGRRCPDRCPRRPIVLCGTSPVSMSCCSAPARSIICTPTSPRS